MTITSSQIGSLSLSISAFLYSIWLLPQIIHNKQHRSLIHVSFLTHTSLLLGSAFDLCYAIGVNMPLRYLWVSCLTLTLMLIQHQQWSLHTRDSKQHTQYRLLSVAVVCLCCFTLLQCFCKMMPRIFLVNIGLLANGSFLLYPIPQILKQRRLKNADGFSIGFIWISLVINCLDFISAITLSWPYPSIIGSMLLIICQLILLYQYATFHKYKIFTHETRSRYC